MLIPALSLLLLAATAMLRSSVSDEPFVPSRVIYH